MKSTDTETYESTVPQLNKHATTISYFRQPVTVQDYLEWSNETSLTKDSC